jgi:hypothetical protein
MAAGDCFCDPDCDIAMGCFCDDADPMVCPVDSDGNVCGCDPECI